MGIKVKHKGQFSFSKTGVVFDKDIGTDKKKPSGRPARAGKFISIKKYRKRKPTGGDKPPVRRDK